MATPTRFEDTAPWPVANLATGEVRGAPESMLEVQRQESLLKTGALQDAIFNSAHFSSIATDEHGVIQIFNVGAERMLGYAADEVVNRITPADISDPQEVIARAESLSLELGTPITPGFEALVFKASRGIEDIYELTYIRKDGSRVPAMVSVTALRDSREVILGFLLIGTDNTARKQVETERKSFELALQAKNVELVHASRMKSEFLATMSHELRTPLNAIIGFSEALKDGLMGPVSATQHEYIGDIFTSGQHLLSLINDILDLSKVEAGMMALELEAFELYPVLASSLSIVREKAASQRISLVLEADKSLGIAQLDLRKTKQIIYNLLANAVKFSSVGSRVTLCAKRVGRMSVGKLSGERPFHGFALPDSSFTDFLEICVTDSGIGISQADMAKLFQAFSQIDSGLARKFEGTGLGLAMVKQLAELHGGTVGVASREGRGASFAAWLPMRESGATSFSAGAIPALGNPAASVSKERMALVVEDDEKAADLMRLLLEADGFTVLLAASGEAALQMAPRHALCLITLDIQLPGMDGWEFLHRIREMDVLARVPVVVVSSLAENNLALADGAAAVLQKPVNRAQLKASLAGLGLFPDVGHTHSILVVDDDPKAIDVIAAFLPEPSYSVARAHGGAEAIEMAQRLRPDLILLDLMMPGVSGFDVAEALRSSPDTARIPIIVITAKTITDQDREALHIVPGGIINIVSKAAFNRASFVDEVRRVLQPRSAGA